MKQKKRITRKVKKRRKRKRSECINRALMFRTILDISENPDMRLCAWIADKQFVLNCNRQSPFDDIVSAFEVFARR